MYLDSISRLNINTWRVRLTSCKWAWSILRTNSAFNLNASAVQYLNREYTDIQTVNFCVNKYQYDECSLNTVSLLPHCRFCNLNPGETCTSHLDPTTKVNIIAGIQLPLYSAYVDLFESKKEFFDPVKGEIKYSSSRIASLFFVLL